MLIIIFNLFNLAFSSANIEYNMTTDSIFLGNVTSLQISINNLKNGEFPNFIESNNDSNYSFISSKLDDNSAIFHIQFWNSGKVIIPPIKIDIMENKKHTYSMFTDSIFFLIHSNLMKDGNIIKPMKPMKNINLINKNKITIMSILILLFIIILSYSFKKLKKNKIIVTRDNNMQLDIYGYTIKKINKLYIPTNNNLSEIEGYYSNLSYYIKKFIKDTMFIRATEMTSNEISIFFEKNNLDKKFILKWNDLNNKADKRKYAGMLPHTHEIEEERKSFLKLIDELNNNIKNKL